MLAATEGVFAPAAEAVISRLSSLSIAENSGHSSVPVPGLQFRSVGVANHVYVGSPRSVWLPKSYGTVSGAAPAEIHEARAGQTAVQTQGNGSLTTAAENSNTILTKLFKGNLLESFTVDNTHLSVVYNCSAFSHYLHRLNNISGNTQSTIFAKKPSVVSISQRYIKCDAEVMSSSGGEGLLQRCQCKLRHSKLGPNLPQIFCISGNPCIPPPFYIWVSCYCSKAFRRLNGPPSRSLRRRMRKRPLAAAKPSLDEAQFQRLYHNSHLDSPLKSFTM